MKGIRNISKRYYLRQIAACFLISCLFFNTSVLLALEPTNLTSSTGLTGASWGSNTVLDTENGAILDWSSFNTTASESVTFNQYLSGSLNSTSAVLNRITSGAIPTQFDGALSPHGRVFIVNPAGVIFGAGASVNVAQLVASSLNISNDDFISGNYKFIGGNGAVINYAGMSDPTKGIHADSVALIGKMVQNSGIITTTSGGFVAMVAGDKVLLGEPGSKIIVEADSVAEAVKIASRGPAGEDIEVTAGDVINNGKISAPAGQVVLAAGDIFSVPIHPQLDEKAVRVEVGTGTVEQLGTINADGADSSVILTAGDEVTLGTGSQTTSIGGKVIIYAYDFDNKTATAYFNSGAEIQVGNGFAAINGNHFLYKGTADISSGGTLQIDPVTLTIADVIPATGPQMDTFYRQWIESFSKAGVNLDLAADEMITVEYMAAGGGQIRGGTGDITLRNVFDIGGINFLANSMGVRTAINTIPAYEAGNGGNIYMLGGAGGITTGDITTSVLSNDKVSDPGKIRLFTNNGGDISTGALTVIGGSYDEISAIASTSEDYPGNLTIDGPVRVITNQVPSDTKEIGQAILCLLAGGDILIDGEVVVNAHGKFESTADIRVCAGGDATVNGSIAAEAKTSESDTTYTANASVLVHAGWNKEGPGTITTGQIKAKASLSGTGGPLELKAQGQQADLFKSEKGKTVKIEINNNVAEPCPDCPLPPPLPPVPVVFWLVDDQFETGWRAGNISGFDPADLDVLLNDNGIKFDASNIISSLTTDKGGTLELVQFTDPVTQKTYLGFKYTPPTDQPFEWDGVSEVASFTDTFEYQAEKEIDGKTVLSRNTATVTITVENILPVLSDGSQTIHMNNDAAFDLATVFELPSVPLENTIYIIDSDGTPGMTPDTYGELIYAIVEGQIPVADGSIATDSGLIPDTLTMSGDTITYSPLDGYVSPGGLATTFGYKVTDNSVVYPAGKEQTGALEVTVTNELPTGDAWLGTTHMDTPLSNVGLAGGSFTDTDGDTVTIGTGPYKGQVIGSTLYGGTLTYDGDYTYTPDAALSGYVGDDADTFGALGYVADDKFDVSLWDGQRTYYKDGHSETLSTDYGAGTISVDITNTLPSGDAWLGTTHMDTPLNNVGLAGGSFTDIDGDTVTIGTGPYKGQVIGSTLYGGTLTYDGDYTYTPDAALLGYVGDDADTFGAPGYAADDKFDVQLYDGQRNYVFDGSGNIISDDLVSTAGTISVDITNTLPSVSGDLGDVPADATTIIPQTGISNPVIVTDPEGSLDNLSLVEVIYIGSENGTLSFNGTSWIYTPANGYTGPEVFNVKAWDGQNEYIFASDGKISSVIPEYGQGLVTINVLGTTPTIPPPPVPVIRVPEAEGCPAVIDAAANEIGVPRQTIQIAMARAMAGNSGIQPCDTCSSLVSSAEILRDADGSSLAALEGVINSIVDPNRPFDDTVRTMIATAFEENKDENSQYATALEYVEAFVQYVSIINEMGVPIDDPVAFTMEKYGTGLAEQTNPNIAAYVAARLAEATVE